MSSASSSTRAPRKLEIDADLARRLALLAADEGRPPSANLDLDKLLPVEITLGLAFRDDLLALFAIALPSLSERYQFSLGAVVGHSGALRESGKRGDLIGLAVCEAGIYAIDKRTAGDATQIRLIGHREEETNKTNKKMTALQWLDLVAGREAGAPETGGAFEAFLHRKPPMATAPGQVIRHKVFGRGTAFSEVGDGPNRKVTCDFPGVGLKVIQARFLEYGDEP